MWCMSICLLRAHITDGELLGRIRPTGGAVQESGLVGLPLNPPALPSNFPRLSFPAFTHLTLVVLCLASPDLRKLNGFPGLALGLPGKPLEVNTHPHHASKRWGMGAISEPDLKEAVA